MAPNLLTFISFLCSIGHFGLLALYDYDFRSATAPPSGLPDLPAGVGVHSWVWIGVAVLIFLSHTLDGRDGIQQTVSAL